MLVGVSTDYYSRLEQGRERNPSARVVAALADTFLLEGEAVAYLRALADPGSSRDSGQGQPEFPCAGLVKFMDAWPATPAMVEGRYADVLAANAPGGELFGWLGDETNLLRAVFLKPEAQSFYRDWSQIAQRYVAGLRAANTEPDDARLAELVRALSTGSRTFAGLWDRHEVGTQKSEVRRFNHPIVGELSLLRKSFISTSSPGQYLVVYYAEPGSSDERAVTLLTGHG